MNVYVVPKIQPSALISVAVVNNYSPFHTENGNCCQYFYRVYLFSDMKKNYSVCSKEQ